MKKLIATLLAFIFFISPLIAEDTTYKDVNFPQWAKDLRRTEIITFGSLPFVTLWTTVGYSLAVKGEFHSPLDKSSSGFDTDDQKAIIGIAAATSLGLGLLDLGITLISRRIKARKNRKQRPDEVVIIPLSQEMKEWRERGENGEPMPPEMQIPQEYLQGGLESAVF
ncbi:MAG: hypothetical protein IJS09_02705 [Treponema sp.]|nr:hypothetical protein [Treponema sp.]